MASSDDLVELQIFAEIQASAKKAQHQAHEPPSSSAILSASLLNAARLDRHRSTVTAAPSSSPSQTSYDLPQSGPTRRANRKVRASGAGKLKPVGFFRKDPAKQSRHELARRGDSYELGFSSPEKIAASPLAKARQKPKERVQRNASPELEAPAPAVQPETEETTKEVPAGSAPVAGRDGNNVEEVPETPAGTSKGRPNDALKEPGKPLHTSKRKDREQAPKTGRPSKSPRKGAAEDNTGNTSQSKSRDGPQRARSPQVVVSSGDPYIRSTRAPNAKQVETNPPEHETPDEPPQSAQKLPEQDPEIRKPQTSKRRKAKQLNPTSTMTALAMQADDEVYPAESSRPTKQAQQEPPPSERGQPQRRKGRKLTSSESINEQASTSAQGQETQPREIVSRPRKANLPQASNRSGDAEVAPGQEDGNSEVVATRQTRSKTKTNPRDPVSVPTAHSERSQRDTSQRHRLKRPHKHARTTADNVQREPNMEQEDDRDRGATDVDESYQSRNQDVTDGKDDRDGDHDHNAQLSEVDMIFKFLESAEYSGACQTEDAMAVKDACRIALDVLADPDSTLDEVSVTTKHIQKSLSRYGAGSDNKQRKLLKVDAYAYLFRQVVSYLKLLYDWLLQKYRDLESSLDSMRIVAPLVYAIVSLKDKIADWDIRIPTRYKGVRLIKDVDINLIVPLRRLSQEYLTILRDLKDQARKRRAYEELEQKRREREQDEVIKQEMEAFRIEKLNGWIELHVCRLRIEPSAHRRQALSMRQDYFDKKVAKWTGEVTGGREERDANGVLFSRLDLFKKRVVPPASPCSADAEKDWTDEQMEALIYGLQNFAGPCVFHKIFEHACGVGQPLRRFGVPEITAKALDVKERLLRMYEDREWKDVPKWIEKIPILP
ncbi:hypothetical protein PSPO01_08099 [Paraphaeosphaeria sporulosa]